MHHSATSFRRRHGTAAVLLIVVGLLSNTAASAPTGHEIVSGALRERAIRILRDGLENQEGWVKVHAAEFLLELSYPQGVREAFEKELEWGMGRSVAEFVSPALMVRLAAFIVGQSSWHGRSWLGLVSGSIIVIIAIYSTKIFPHPLDFAQGMPRGCARGCT